MDPRHRLKRRFPGEDLGDPGPIGRRLLERDREPAPLRQVAGEVLHVPVWGPGRNNRKVADPRPNAPLLIRIVRYPYALKTERGRRHTAFEAGVQKREGLLDRPYILREAREARGEPVQGNPIKAVPTKVPRLQAVPSVADWLESRRG